MTDNNNDDSGAQPPISDDPEQIPVMQRVLDNPFLLLVLGTDGITPILGT